MVTKSPVPTKAHDPARLSNLEPHGERRRQQLVRAAAHVIEYEGLDALRMPRVAELAGCARTLVYRYFPTREDLLMGVVSEYYDGLETEMDRRNPRREDTPTASDDLEASLPMFDVVFDVVTDLGLAGLLLRTSPHMGEALREHIAKESTRFSRRWIEPLRRAGLSDLQSALVSEAAVAVLVELVTRWQRSEITRDVAVELSRVTSISLMRGLAAQAEQ